MMSLENFKVGDTARKPVVSGRINDYRAGRQVQTKVSEPAVRKVSTMKTCASLIQREGYIYIWRVRSTQVFRF